MGDNPLWPLLLVYVATVGLLAGVAWYMNRAAGRDRVTFRNFAAESISDREKQRNRLTLMEGNQEAMQQVLTEQRVVMERMANQAVALTASLDNLKAVTQAQLGNQPTRGEMRTAFAQQTADIALMLAGRAPLTFNQRNGGADFGDDTRIRGPVVGGDATPIGDPHE